MKYKEIDITLRNRSLSEPAKLLTYIIDNTMQSSSEHLRPAVIICPGGGYGHLSERESEPIALKMIAAGYHAFILRYHVSPVTYPVQLLELAESIRLIRENAMEWHIDTNRIVVAGFSAGGHLAASLGMFWSEDWLSNELNTTKELIQPNGCLLSYPVITSKEFAHRDSFQRLLGEHYNELLSKVSLEDQVNRNTPPIFIWHTYKDQAVPVENSLLLVAALRKFDISVEFHMYPQGPHGISLATEETMMAEGKGVVKECQGWIDLATRWIKDLGGNL